MPKSYTSLSERFKVIASTSDPASYALIADCLLTIKHYEDTIISLSDMIEKEHSELLQLRAALKPREEP